MDKSWYLQKPAELFTEFQTSEQGLTAHEAARRLAEGGPNKLPEARPRGYGGIFFSQFQSPLIYILLGASAGVFWIGEVADGSIILAVLFFNAVVGTIQEGRAQNILRALRHYVATQATIVREGTEIIIPDAEVVPGDLLTLREGEKVAADARVIASRSLTLDEAALTGESLPVSKSEEDIHDGGVQTSDQKNMVFKGTHVLAGSGRAIVVGTGTGTVIGRIAKTVASIDTEIPLRANIRALSRGIIVVVATFAAAIFALGIIFGNPIRTMFATVVSLSVSVIPEGLPVVMTLILATGVYRMGKRHALVKRLQAVEALGQARVIAVDKTGTLTRNELMVQKIYVDGHTFGVGGTGYDPTGEITLGDHAVDPLNHEELLLIGKAAAFCANAQLMFREEAGVWQVAGDPTEAALLVCARKIGFHKDELEKESPLVEEIPFDYHIKYHATVHKTDGAHMLTVIGAPEAVLAHSRTVWTAGGDVALDKAQSDRVQKELHALSHQGLRVLGVGIRHGSFRAVTPETLSPLTFVGLIGIKDVLRPEVHEAMARATAAGMRVVMITGDHAVTARAIAEEAGIFHPGDEVITGAEIEQMTSHELAQKISRVSVFARATPEHKLKLIQAFRARGEIVAMTGDGVNDAPSLVAADLGVAMGKIGTEVAKEAADIVLLDDNFGSIVGAVEEGRSIYRTIKKVILYLFSTGAGEVLTISGALMIGLPLPILPAQIIWLNFVTDGFLDVALAMEPKEPGLLAKKFERPKKYLVDKLMAERMFVMAIPMALGSLMLFRVFLNGDITKAWTISLTTLAVFQWFNAWNCRSEEMSIFRMNPLQNKFLVVATCVVIILQLFAVYHPVFQNILHTTALNWSDWLMILPVAASIIVAEEVRKWLMRARIKK